jgi:hypothetical protein
MMQNIIKKLFYPQKVDKYIDIPDKLVIECEIETPQFLGSKEKFKMFKQYGNLHTDTMLFIPSDIFSGHRVQFKNIEDFKKYVVKIY